MSSTEAFIYLFILNSDTQRACPRPHTSNKAVAADVFALRLVFRAVLVSQSRTISIKNPPRKKGLSAWQQDQVDTRCFLGKEFSGTPARAKRLSGPVYFNLFYQWLGLKVTQKTVFVLKLTVIKQEITLGPVGQRQTGLSEPTTLSKKQLLGREKKNKTSNKLSTNIWKHVYCNLKISSRGAPLLPKNSFSNLQKGSGPKPQELLCCRAKARWAPATRTNQARQASCFHSVALISASIWSKSLQTDLEKDESSREPTCFGWMLKSGFCFGRIAQALKGNVDLKQNNINFSQKALKDESR